MTILADSGSTKTTWMEVKSGSKIVTEGLNPHFTTDKQFQKACYRVTAQLGIPQQVFFYGAGCGNEEQKLRVKQLLIQAFNTDNVQVETDMLGACRAVCGDKASLVGILGTGSNACYYDGEKIVYQAPSLGYIIGDQGSANHVGRRLLLAYLSGLMPDDIMTRFHETYPLSHAEFIDAIYHKPNANRFLASLAPFALKNSRYSFIEGMLRNNFNDWLFYQVLELMLKSKCKDLCIVGGFAKAMEKKIKQYIEETPYIISIIVADPINGLRKYHKTHKMP